MTTIVMTMMMMMMMMMMMNLIISMWISLVVMNEKVAGDRSATCGVWYGGAYTELMLAGSVQHMR